MLQTGTVVDITDKGMLIVSVRRCSECDGCHTCVGCKEMVGDADSAVIVSAYNKCHAGIGDRVKLETSSALFLLYAFLVFLFPFLPATAGYLIADHLTDGEAIPIITAFVLLIAAFLILRLTVDRKAARRCDCTAVRII